ncbi:PREDICTED: uncharacterized protein LOC105559953 [Vollenhovia emeryi]|uniref:uncharacterized protein LOC105559953 n=1 Tax=Vollenhovia emeryi TaxID=411798 RepID=UPI0005F392D4|nr:PREDICTED: uncharacterized protein LOC105559953 [Vollenhovia emeryi]XP_011864019.1 PREDICTED: uncharacterized protein LOC105559953 [Vollenhovia emeryi]
MEQMRNDWNLLKDKLEIDIIKKYASYMNILTISIIVFCYISIFLYIIFQRLPFILDFILPVNGSRPYQLLMITEYFVDHDKYIQFILLHELLVGYIGLTAVGSTGTTFIIFMSHVCALLEITSYRIENAFERNILAMPNPKKQYLLHRRIAHAVVMHQRAAEFNEFLNSAFLVLFSLLIAVGVSSLALNLFLFCRLILSNDIGRASIIGLLTFTYFIYMFIFNYWGQVVINNGIDLFKVTYNGSWYAAPLSNQKLLLFIMQRGMEHLSVSYFSVFVASLDGFATVNLDFF